MKKVMLGLVMVVMLMSMVGCGTTEEKDGFSPEQIIENNEDNSSKEDFDIENLQKYYNVNEYVGEPILAEVWILDCAKENNLTSLAVSYTNAEGISNSFTLSVEYFGEYQSNTMLHGIVVDKELVYIFTE